MFRKIESDLLKILHERNAHIALSDVKRDADGCLHKYVREEKEDCTASLWGVVLLFYGMHFFQNR